MKKTIIAFAAFAATCAAQAGGFYIGGQYGSAGVKSEDVNTSVDSGRIFGGYRLNEVVAIELGYTQLNGANYTLNTTTLGQRLLGRSAITRGTLTMNGLDLSAIVSPFSSVRGLYFRAGVTEFNTKDEWTNFLDGAAQDSKSKTYGGLGTTFGIGYDWKLGPGALRFEANQMFSISDLRDNDAMTYSIGYLYAF